MFCVFFACDFRLPVRSQQLTSSKLSRTPQFGQEALPFIALENRLGRFADGSPAHGVRQYHRNRLALRVLDGHFVSKRRNLVVTLGEGPVGNNEVKRNLYPYARLRVSGRQSESERGASDCEYQRVFFHDLFS